MAKVLHQFTNEETGCTTFVTEHAKGFAVSLRDDDSGEFLSTVTIYDTVEKAVATAVKVMK